jgi:uncharacterized protein with HEPN domain
MPREIRLYTNDILEAIQKIEDYIGNMELEEFKKDCRTIDAVTRNFEIIGEAVGQIPKEFKERHSEVNWSRYKDYRNILIHEYHGITPENLYFAYKDNLSHLKEQILKIHKEIINKP